jgi:hypothetical protein
MKNLEYGDQWKATHKLVGKPREKTVGFSELGEAIVAQKHTEISEWLVLKNEINNEVRVISAKGRNHLGENIPAIAIGKASLVLDDTYFQRRTLETALHDARAVERESYAKDLALNWSFTEKRIWQIGQILDGESITNKEEVDRLRYELVVLLAPSLLFYSDPDSNVRREPFVDAP